MITKVMDDPKFVIQAKLPGTGKDGGPNCATVRPQAGWAMISVSH